MSDFASAIRPSIVMTIGFTLLCGIAIRSLRKKLEHDPADPRLFVNEPGVGYRLATLR